MRSRPEEISCLRGEIVAAKRRGDMEEVDRLSERLALMLADQVHHHARGGIVPGYYGRLSARC